VIRWIEDSAGFDALAEQWDRVAEPHRFPFLRYAWLRCWWNAFGGDKRLAICTAWDGDELVGVFPLCRRGGNLEVMKNVHSPVYRPFARDPATLRALVNAAVEASGSFLLVAHLPDGDPAVPLLVESSRARGMLTLVERQHVSPVVRTNGGVEEYRQSLGRKTFKDLARLRRRLEEEHDDVVFSVAEPPDDLRAQLDESFAVEASGWKGARQTAIVHAAETAAFYRCIAESFTAAGRLRLSSISVGGRMIAFDLCLVDYDRLWILKGGYDEAFRRYAPGLLLTLAEVERCYELGLEAAELLGDDAEWKRKFSNDARAHLMVHGYRRRPLPLARYSYRRFVRPPLRRAHRRVVRVRG
jgi:CelD/BcsL family acetyltransferase involved in cellulose biosynthesis